MIALVMMLTIGIRAAYSEVITDENNPCHLINEPGCTTDEFCVLIHSGDTPVCVCNNTIENPTCSTTNDCTEGETFCNHGQCVKKDTGFIFCVCNEGYCGKDCKDEKPEVVTEEPRVVTEEHTVNGSGSYQPPENTKWDANNEIWKPVYYDAHDFNPHDPFVNATFLDNFDGTTIPRTCDEGLPCVDSPYRTIDGTCNNLDNPSWGAADTVQLRFLDPMFKTGTSTSDNIPRSDNLKSAREISNEVFDAIHNQHWSEKHTASLLWLGQFLSHDLGLTKQPKEPKDCCNVTNHGDERCLTIAVPDWDQYYTVKCKHFTRSIVGTKGCLPNSTNPLDNYKEINNFQTAYIDLSLTYGNSDEEAMELRNLTGGRLNVKISEQGQHLLPERNDTIECPMKKKNGSGYCQKTGDPRVDNINFIGATHLLMVRAHNWIADNLTEINPHWNDEKLYQEARKILIALFQNIVYKEYLPEVLGPYLSKNNKLCVNDTGYQDDYNTTVNGQIRNEFLGAAFRWGHSILPAHQAYLLDDHCLMDWYTVIDTFKCSEMLYANGGLNLTAYVRWMSWDKSMKNDRFMEDEYRNYLFGGEDLAARNIQRGRDHGISTYNHFRTFCGLKPVSFDDFILEDHDWESSNALRNLYSNADDIDLYVGAMTEESAGGSILGPTFTCLSIKQFSLIRASDRYWYERPGMFTLDQLNSIKQVKLAKLTCQVFDIPTIQEHVFVLVNYNNANPLCNCSSLTGLDFSLWQE
ncbi:peroxidase-like isoform X2 [Mytilus trossulus]|uniref:peroxidase-like isoform X2 n=1 Tax=Mytilus trossulus TaxID=6551 RepID=UPI00300708FC